MGREDHWEAAQEGAERLAEGDTDGAISELSQLVVRQPQNEYAFYFLGSAHYEAGTFPKAMKAYVTALELAPDYVGAMTHLGHTLRMLGRYGEAIRMGKQVLSRSPEDADALYLIGTSHFAQGNNREAAEHLERYLTCRPDAESAIEVEGMLQLMRGEAVPAIAEGEPN